MAYKYRTMEQLKDSQLLYDREPHRFGLSLIFIVLIALVGCLLWSAFTPRVYIVRGVGSIVSEERNFLCLPTQGRL